MTSISKYVFIDKLDHMVQYHSAIRKKPVDVKSNTFFDFDKKNHERDNKFKVGDHVKIPKYQKKFAIYYVSNWPEEVVAIKKVKSTVSWTYVISDLNREEIVGAFYEQELKKKKVKQNLE